MGTISIAFNKNKFNKKWDGQQMYVCIYCMDLWKLNRNTYGGIPLHTYIHTNIEHACFTRAVKNPQSRCYIQIFHGKHKTYTYIFIYILCLLFRQQGAKHISPFMQGLPEEQHKNRKSLRWAIRASSALCALQNTSTDLGYRSIHRLNSTPFLYGLRLRSAIISIYIYERIKYDDK